MNFSRLLTHWYLRHKRELPWRSTSNPYFIWLSEIMLQQTRVAQGLPYYLAFIEAFPTVFKLAEASEEQVLKLWQGLGYYSRARNLHSTAKYIANELNGKFPENYESLIRLKGIGEYTAAAIASFAFDERVPVVDGNVFRVLSRVFDIETDILSSSAKKEFTSLAKELMLDAEPALFNQSIMEFGALQCVPKNPACDICPLNSACLALKLNKVNALPVKFKKAKSKDRFLNYLVVADEENNTVIQKRTGKGIWQNLYEFPFVETKSESALDQFIPELMEQYEILSVEELFGDNVLHKLTHQNLHIKFNKINVKGRVENGTSADRLREFPFPIVLFNFIEKHWK